MKKIKGFTLIELVIVLIILGIIASLGGMILEQAIRSSSASQKILEAATQGQAALQRLARELREVRTATASDLNISSNSQINFTDIRGEAITYSQSGSNLLRNSQIVADGLKANSLNFTYYDDELQTTTTPEDVRCILIKATIAKSDIDTPFETMACPRNFTL